MELIHQSYLLGILFGHWCISFLSFLISLISLTLTRSYLSRPAVRGEMVICPQGFICFSTQVTLSSTWHPFITGAQVQLWGGVSQVVPTWLLLPKAWDGSPSTMHIRWFHSTVLDEILGMLTTLKNIAYCYVFSRGSPSWQLVVFWLTITWTQITISRVLSKSRLKVRKELSRMVSSRRWWQRPADPCGIHPLQAHLTQSLSPGLESLNLERWPSSCEPKLGFLIIGRELPSDF